MGQLKLKLFGVVMGDKKIYVVAKIFDQQGCLAYLCKTPNEVRCLPGTLEALRADGIQIVILDSPEIYSEYAPYTYIEDMKEFIDKVAQLNRAARHVTCADCYLTTTAKSLGSPVRQGFRGCSSKWRKFVRYQPNRCAAVDSDLTA